MKLSDKEREELSKIPLEDILPFGESHRKYKSDDMYEIAKEIFPDASDDTIEFLLWEKTCFPLDNQAAVRQLEKLKSETLARSGFQDSK